MKGKPNNTINANIKMETPRRIQNISLTCPVAMPTMIVRTSNAKVSVIIVPPTVILTALFFADTQFTDNRIGDQCMGGEHTGE